LELGYLPSVLCDLLAHRAFDRGVLVLTRRLVDAVLEHGAASSYSSSGWHGRLHSCTNGTSAVTARSSCCSVMSDDSPATL
jgi:hypothetical protein